MNLAALGALMGGGNAWACGAIIVRNTGMGLVTCSWYMCSKQVVGRDPPSVVLMQNSWALTVSCRTPWLVTFCRDHSSVNYILGALLI